MNKQLSSRLIWAIGIICVGIYLLYPVFRSGFLVTDDGNWMIIRLSAFYQSLREGQFPVRYLGRLNHGYGYPVANFLYPGFLYIGSLIHAAGIPFQTTVEIILVGFVLIGAVSLYYWLQHFFDTRASALGALSFLLSPYLLFDIYKRGSVGEIVAMGTFVFTLFVIDSGRLWLIAPAVAFLFISHNTLAIVFIGLLTGYIFVTKRWNCTTPFLLGLGLATFFWMPVLYEKHLVVFDSVIISDPTHYFPISNLLIMRSLPILLLVGFSVFFSKKNIKKDHWFFLITLFLAVFFASEISSSAWTNPLLRRFVQFPYRLLAVVSVIGPWFVAYVSDRKRFALGIVLSVSALCFLWFSVIPYQNSQSMKQPDGYYTTNEDTTTVANEYMPRWVISPPVTRAPKRIEVISGNAVIEERRNFAEKVDILVHAREISVLQINSVYYPGWGAMLDDSPVPIAYDNAFGLMRVTVPQGEHRIFMAFRETKSRFIADMISILSLCAWFLYFVIKPFGAKKGAGSSIRKKTK